MRKYFSLIFICIFLFSILSLAVLFESIQQEITKSQHFLTVPRLRRTQNESSIQDTQINRIECSFVASAHLKKIGCLRKNNKIYLPFDFVRKKFDITGNQLQEKENTKFEILFSSSPVYMPSSTGAYNSCREYLWFNNIDVETRDRVKFINLKDGVPVSSQWNKSGHIYPVQVAQFGLSHFSKWIAALDSSKTNRTISMKKFIKFALDENKKQFFYHMNMKNAIVKSIENGFGFNFPDKAFFKMNYSSLNVTYLVADLKVISRVELFVDLKFNKAIVKLIYRFDYSNEESNSLTRLTTHLDQADNTFQVVYSMRSKSKSFKLIRNICVDACKGLKWKKCILCMNSNSSLYFKVYKFSLQGQGSIENATFHEYLDERLHFELAQQAADYLVGAQNKLDGGWPISVQRKFDKNSKIHLNQAKWYSAMAQGHAISLLCRIYSVVKDEKYFKAAANGLKLFEMNVKNGGGVRAYLFNDLNNTWYEEYPTEPHGLFVLNGFIYSLVGLYDFIYGGCSNMDASYKREKAIELFSSGLKSLIKNINLFDTGQRSLYDLRHLQGDLSVNPNVARWDYHSVHVSQLFYLIEMIKNSVNRIKSSLLNRNETEIQAKKLLEVANRWLNYTKGKWNENSQIN